MDLLLRFFNILRANLHFGSSDDVSDGFDRRQPHERTASWGAPGAARADRARPDYDPELAGYYANLELPYGADLKRVRRAWKRLLRKYHPDLHSRDPEKQRIANELTQALNHAYEELVKRLDT